MTTWRPGYEHPCPRRVPWLHEVWSVLLQKKDRTGCRVTAVI